MSKMPPVQFFWEIKPQVYAPYHVRLTRDDGRERREVSGLGSRGLMAKNKRTKNSNNISNITKGKIAQSISNSTPPATTKYTQGLSTATRNNTNWFRKVKPKIPKCSLRIYWREEE